MAGDDCAKALEQMYLFLDAELDSASLRRIQEHLDECGPCLQHFDLERVVKQLVVRSCGNSHAPEELRTRVLTRIREVQVSITDPDVPRTD
jgi:mycothiol system anti-sigma-R factor